MSVRNRIAAIERKIKPRSYPAMDIFLRDEDESLEEVMQREGRSMSDYSDPTVRDFMEVVYVSVKKRQKVGKSQDFLKLCVEINHE